MTSNKPEQKNLFLTNGMIAIIVCIVILIIALIGMGMIQQGQQATKVTLQPTALTTPAPVKSARPVADLYVMSFCPYGTQAETVMAPVVDLLKTKADIRIRYITTVGGPTIDSVNSLHGPAEAREDLIQICINRYYPEQFWQYLNTFNQQCYPGRGNATYLESCRKKIVANLSFDDAKINTCATGTEGITLLKTDEVAAAKSRATASPMLFVNGVMYPGARTPEGYKEAICAAFETVPPECSTVLSRSSTSAAGNC